MTGCLDASRRGANLIDLMYNSVCTRHETVRETGSPEEWDMEGESKLNEESVCLSVAEKHEFRRLHTLMHVPATEGKSALFFRQSVFFLLSLHPILYPLPDPRDYPPSFSPSSFLHPDSSLRSIHSPSESAFPLIHAIFSASRFRSAVRRIHWFLSSPFFLFCFSSFLRTQSPSYFMRCSCESVQALGHAG